MAQIRPEDKEEVTMNQWIDEGVHKVKIVTIDQETNSNGKEYYEVAVEDEDGAVGTTRLYLSEAAMKYSLSTLRSIVVHNTADPKREAARKEFDSFDDTEKLLAYLQKTLIGGECWYSKFPNGQTYQNAQGETRNSYDTNIASYEMKPPKKSQEQMVSDLLGASTSAADEPDIPFGA